jgi:ATP-dependent DNA helicase RecQ
VGELKLANYGQRFLEVISQHCGPSQATPSGVGAADTIQIRRLPGSRSGEIAKLFVEGQTIEQIASAFEIKPGTVVQNLSRFQQAGGKLDPERVLGESNLRGSDRARVFALFEQLGTERLAPVYEALGGSVPYEELHLLRLYRVCKGSN